MYKDYYDSSKFEISYDSSLATGFNSNLVYLSGLLRDLENAISDADSKDIVFERVKDVREEVTRMSEDPIFRHLFNPFAIPILKALDSVERSYDNGDGVGLIILGGVISSEYKRLSGAINIGFEWIRALETNEGLLASL